MSFFSILFKANKNNLQKKTTEPPFFKDLNLDIIIDDIIKNKEEYDLKPFFYSHLIDIETIRYRQDIAKDIEKKEIFQHLNSFADSMRTIRKNLDISEKLNCKYQKERWFIDSVNEYCNAVVSLKDGLVKSNPESEGLNDFLKFLGTYTASGEFKTLFEKTKNLKKDISKIRYSVFIKENRIRVQKYDNESDYGAEILEVFNRFKQQEVEGSIVEFHKTYYMNHVESSILKFVAKLYDSIFSELESYCLENEHFMDETVKRFDMEVQFYISYAEYTDSLTKLNLKFCYPDISSDNKNVYDYCVFDLALAYKLYKESKKTVVCNDFYLNNKERIFVVTGPNQGGKTTFARSFGQIHYLSSLGLKVPGNRAKLFVFDNIFTHFEKEEKIDSLHGKLENDLVRIYDILKNATQNSIIIMNEIFSSTSSKDALFLSENILNKIIELDCLSVFVTFLVKLSSLNEKIVSMTSTVNPNNTTLRTFRIIRRQADGLSYALSLAQKHCLTYECLKDRIKL